MREIAKTSQFKSDFKKLAKAGRYSIEELLTIIRKLAEDIPLAGKYLDHPLSGAWSDHRECHIRPDWLLIYRLEQGKITLVRTGTHSDLFG